MSEPHFFPRLRQETVRETWCLDSFSFEGGRFSASGWALPIEGDASRGQILVNGFAPNRAAYGQHRSDIAAIYGYLPNAASSHFEISGFLKGEGLESIELSYHDPLRDSFADPFKSYFIPLAAERWPFPDHLHRTRTTGAVPEATFAFGGYTMARKIDAVLKGVTGDGLSGRGSILDWGGGCGRVTRYLRMLAPDARVALGDIDSDNVAWCAANLDGVFHTHDYIRERWGEYFEILDIIPEASNNHQDIVVMRRR